MGERTAGFRARLGRGGRMAGTFLKTPAPELVEVLALSGLDFLCLDAEHAPFGRREMDLCCGIGRALDLPILVRIPAAREEHALQALDAGAVGLVVPHVLSAGRAAAMARAARFGRGGRGYAGSSRWAGWASRAMPDVLAQDAETCVIAQIEEPEGVEAAREIAGTPGIDALFVGPADLSVGYGHQSIDNPDVAAAFAACREAAEAAGVPLATWVPNAAKAAEWADRGVTAFVVGSEHAWMLAGAREAARIADG
ncbi:2-keto-3-deoxy-L-rhamnonate aldolase RhmA [Hasllibacter halocynthiae]|uniref:2-keto-3-deoxy-L-rhamnonate aldolase RhmA n=1 Tax=Hasllibacter halocynthiae TaxID=595589 RepID=A0A2T0X739_9RHOB|nr:aldolase/citrate lyase family protein [Hasllibacter halocynthiae]PRY94749.1 2-keto-3-deoxy-L-rhamnonate aldolase RhmA [Hasllibacter halocynthiae]